MDIQVKDSAIDPDGNEKVILYRKGQTKTSYLVHVFLEGRDLVHVEKVQYELHSTFRNRFKTIEKKYSNRQCKLSIWTWGIFTVKATIHLKNGRKINQLHRLEYNSEFNKSNVTFRRS